MKLILLFLILGSPSYALVEDEHSFTNEPCPVKALSIRNAESTPVDEEEELPN